MSHAQLSPFDCIPPVNPIENEACKSRFVVEFALAQNLAIVRQGCAIALDTLQQEIKMLRSRLSLYETSYFDLESRIVKLDAAIAPHRKLPPEIIRHIFQLAHRDEKPMQLPCRYFSPGERQLSDRHTFRPHHVCSFWREIALTIPEISQSVWHSVEVDYTEFVDPEPYDSIDEDDEDYDAEERLERAQDDLYHHIQAITGYANKILRRGARYLDVTFADNSLTWKEDIDDSWLLIRLLKRFPPTLENLRISHEDAFEDFQETLSSILPSLVHLKSLNLSIYSMNGELALFRLPDLKLSDLVYLDLSDSNFYDAGIALSMEDCCSLFSGCSQLRQCTITIGCCHDDAFATVESKNSGHSITLARLNTLHFFRRGCSHISTKCDSATLLERLILPSLRILEIETSYPFHSRAQSLLDLLKRSRCRLTELTIGDRITEEGQEPDWTTLITDSLEDLKILSVPRYSIDLDILRMIARKEYLPNLERIKCRVEIVEEACSAVESLLRSRYVERHPGQDAPKWLVNFMTR